MGSSERAPIYIRITVAGKRAEISTKRSIDPAKWNAAKNAMKGSSDEAKELNSYLQTIKMKVYQHHPN